MKEGGSGLVDERKRGQGWWMKYGGRGWLMKKEV